MFYDDDDLGDIDLVAGAEALRGAANDAYRFAQDELAAHPAHLPESVTVNDAVAAFITSLNVIGMIGLIDPAVKQLVVQMARQLIEDGTNL